MRHSFTDKHCHIASPVHCFDTRLKFLLVFIGIIIMVSEPKGRLYAFGLYAPLILIFLFLSRIPLRFFLLRLLILAPFFSFAALFYPLSHHIGGATVDASTYYIALSIFFKALLSVMLLLLLTASEKFQRLLAGMQKLGMPNIIGVIASLMNRYMFILADEAMRTTTARKSRTPGRLKQGKLKVFGNQIAMVFLRSWERSKTLYNAMLSRGFNGTFHCAEHFAVKPGDIIVFVVLSVVFLSIRFSEQLYIFLF